MLRVCNQRHGDDSVHAGPSNRAAFVSYFLKAALVRLSFTVIFLVFFYLLATGCFSIDVGILCDLVFVCRPVCLLLLTYVNIYINAVSLLLRNFFSAKRWTQRATSHGKKRKLRRGSHKHQLTEKNIQT